jgi:YXWGXW repeat-containing protein
MKTKLIALFLLAGSAMFAETHFSVGIGVGPRYGYYAPPPPVYYAPAPVYGYAPAPRPGFIWVSGYWSVDGYGRRLWVPGHWERRYRGGYWNEPRYRDRYYDRDYWR